MKPKTLWYPQYNSNNFQYVFLTLNKDFWFVNNEMNLYVFRKSTLARLKQVNTLKNYWVASGNAINFIAVSRFASSYYGSKGYHIDSIQKTIKDHFHFHIRSTTSKIPSRAQIEMQAHLKSLPQTSVALPHYPIELETLKETIENCIMTVINNINHRT